MNIERKSACDFQITSFASLKFWFAELGKLKVSKFISSKSINCVDLIYCNQQTIVNRFLSKIFLHSFVINSFFCLRILTFMEKKNETVSTDWWLTVPYDILEFINPTLCMESVWNGNRIFVPNCDFNIS